MTVVALNLGTVVGGAVIIEQIFGLPGMGQTLVSGIGDRDSPVVQGIVLALAIAVVGANLLADILYIVFDPRLRHGR
jgi:peptide/nickel transport system permease protein